MPEMPEVQAHAERLTAADAGRVLRRFVPLTFTALKTAVPAPDDAYGRPLVEVGRRGKYLLLDFEPVTFVVHLMQGGRLARRRQAVGQAPRRPGPLGVRRRRPGVAAHRAGHRAQGRGVVRADRRRRHVAAHRRAGTGGGDDRGRGAGGPLRRPQHAPARVPARPAPGRRHRTPAGQRGAPPGQAVAVRDDRQARARPTPPPSSPPSATPSPRASSTSAAATT